MGINKPDIHFVASELKRIQNNQWHTGTVLNREGNMAIVELDINGVKINSSPLYMMCHEVDAGDHVLALLPDASPENGFVFPFFDNRPVQNGLPA